MVLFWGWGLANIVKSTNLIACISALPPAWSSSFFFYYTVRCDQTLKISHIIFWSIVVKMAGILFGDRLATFFACMNCFVSFQLEDWRCLSAWHLPKVHTCETNACTKFHLKMNTSYLKSSKHLLIQNKVLKSEVLICKWFERKRWRHTYLLLVCVKHWDTFKPLVERKRNSLYMRKK